MVRKLIIFGIILIACYDGYTQRVGVGTVNPLARLSVDSAVMIDQSNSNNGTLGSGALLFGSDGLVGMGRSTVNGSAARSGISFYAAGLRRMLIDSIGNVGIGTSLPLQRLHVNGNMYTSGNIGVGTDPNYRLHVNGDGYFQNSNIGINILPSSTYSLYAAGNVRFTDDVRFDGIVNPNNALTIGNNTSIDGSLTVGGRGIVRGSGAGQWRIVRVQVAYAGGIGAHSDLIGAALAFNLGGATLAGIFVGPIVQAGAGSSNLSSIGLVPTDISNTGCRFLIMNGSSTAADLGSAANPTIWQLTMLVFE
ncbi:MAG: hypothetical protein IPK57_13065 [Chitinophagaceae bacterium]|nr:hypothetical protein [Chitinophagaceae bacterium]